MRISITYHHLTHHIVPGPQSISYFLPLILLPIALLIPQSVLSRWQNSSIFLPAILASTMHAWMVMGCIDVISVNAVLWSFYFLLLRDPWRDFTRIERSAASTAVDGPKSYSNGSVDASQLPTNDVNKDSRPATNKAGPLVETKHNVGEESYPLILSQRIPWIIRLLISIRLNNWKIGLPSHDNQQPPPPGFRTRREFLLTALLSFCRGYLILDLTSAYTHYDPYFQNVTQPITSPLPASFSSQLGLIPPQFLRAMIIGLQAWVLISQMFYAPCLLPIFLNYLNILPNEISPHTWAPYFGDPSTIFLHGIRGFWGQYWHQTMRHSCSGPGYALVELFGLRRGGAMRYSLINFVAFGLSGIVHMGLVPPQPLHATVTSNRIRLYIAGFFWVQPVGMLVEILVLRVLDVTGIGTRSLAARHSSLMLKVRILINALWVIAWFSLCLPLLGEAARQLDYFRVWLVPLSLWKFSKGEEFVTWKFS